MFMVNDNVVVIVIYVIMDMWTGSHPKGGYRAKYHALKDMLEADLDVHLNHYADKWRLNKVEEDVNTLPTAPNINSR